MKSHEFRETFTFMFYMFVLFLLMPSGKKYIVTLLFYHKLNIFYLVLSTCSLDVRDTQKFVRSTPFADTPRLTRAL